MVTVRSLLRKPLTWVVVALGVAGMVVGLAAFQPWKLWVDQTVSEELPAAKPATTPDMGRATPAPGGPVTLAQGSLISHEHTTSGTVRVARLADGSRVLRLEDLDTSNGPDLKVWLTNAPVKPGRAGWHVFDDGTYVDLGPLKGNKGDQNYPLPADADLGELTSVSIWCDRFNVSFGAAALTPV